MRVLESTFSCGDSVLGSHSADFGGLEATADLKSSSAPKPPKNYESPTATPRILEKHKQAGREKSCREQTELESTFEKVDSSLNALFPSLRALHRKAWQSTSSKNAKAQKVDSRNFTQAAQSLSTPQGKKAESVFSNQPQAAGFLMKSATNLKTQQDSRICDEKTRRSRSFFSKSLLCERVQGRILGRM